jgi:hypothetical protein
MEAVVHCKEYVMKKRVRAKDVEEALNLPAQPEDEARAMSDQSGADSSVPPAAQESPGSSPPITGVDSPSGERNEATRDVWDIFDELDPHACPVDTWREELPNVPSDMSEGRDSGGNQRVWVDAQKKALGELFGLGGGKRRILNVGDLSVDDGIAAVLTPLEEVQRTALRESIDTHGLNTVLYVWHREDEDAFVVLDGIERFLIADDLQIDDCVVVEVDLPNGAAAKAFRIAMNLGPRPVNVYQRSLCVLHRVAFFSAVVDETMVRCDKCLRCKRKEKGERAVLAGLARRTQTDFETISRVEYIENNLEEAFGEEKAEEVRAMLFAGKKRIRVVYNDVRRALKPTRHA